MSLWVPSSLPRIYDCPFCGAEHDEIGLGRCANEHRDVIEAGRLESRIPIMDENQWDPEVSARLRETGRKMIAEGRLVMKPNERIKDN